MQPHTGELLAELKALSHDVVFLATCNAILLLGYVKLTNTCFHHRLLIYFNIPNICHKFTSLKSRTALQAARKIAPCDRALTGTSNVCSADSLCVWQGPPPLSK